MEMLRNAVAAAILAGGLMTAPAGATVMEAVFTGTVSSGYDLTGEFISPESYLDGQSFTLTYIYDTAIGYRDTITDAYDLVYGGSTHPAPNPTISAILTIGARSLSIAGEYNSSYSLCDLTFCAYDTYEAFVHDDVRTLDGSVYSSYFNVAVFGMQVGMPIDLETAFQFNTDDNYEIGSFSYSNHDGSTETLLQYTHGFLDLDSVTVSVLDDAPAPVPLPASGLMLAGAGLSLAALRRRGKRAA